VYYGNQGWKMEQVRAMERWQGKKNATVLLFTNFCNRATDNLFSQQLPNIWNNGNVPIITWEPFLCKNTPPDIENQIANGAYNSYIRDWAGRLKVWLSGTDGVYGTADDRRAYLRFAHEMNGDWYPWSAAVGGNHPDAYKRMWQAVRGIFTSQGIENSRLQWIWTVNHVDVGGFAAEAYFPGDTEVDWVAIDGYNWGASQSWSSWQSPAQTFDPMLGRLRTLAKPIAITELGSSTATAGGTRVVDKNRWITDMYSYTVSQNVRMVVWFNEDKETDWAVFGGMNGDGSFLDGRTRYKVFSEYRAAISASSYVSATTNNIRLLTDDQFAGK
jgi:beta-mannanase